MDLALDPIAAPPAPAPSAASATAASATALSATAPSGAAPSAAPTGAVPAAAASAAAIGASAAALSSQAPATPRPSPSPSPAASAAPAAASTAAPPAAGSSTRRPSASPSASAAATAGSKGSGRNRARTATAAEPSSFDPERLRLIGLIAALVLLVGGFAIYYWIALTGPGAGAGLPPVPMPPQNAASTSSGAGGAGQIIAANGPAAPAASTAGATAEADADDPMLAPTTGSRANTQDLERRLARTEQELAAAQQAIQAAAATPRTEQLPVLAAPKNEDIRVTRLVQPAPVSPTLDNAYQAFNSGDTAGAQQQYDAALAQDANNRDALLGAAHVAARQNLKDKAAGYYLRLLELSPNDADATAGLIGLRQGDISQSEARLKAILANNPDAGPVLFTLGNLYAQQGRWPDAQQAYFRAVGAAPDNPDYAYNLAIGLDRLNQGKLALGYYQRALALAQDKAVGFDRNALRKRMHELSIATH
jgi:tetratricopeptide (TPR) repeat protein